ncbi:MAG: hypothetical protein QXZ09_06995 [Candidatus Methanomethylicaceae archaeon]
MAIEIHSTDGRIVTYRNTLLEAVHPDVVSDLVIVRERQYEFKPEWNGKKASFFSSNIKSLSAFYGSHHIPEMYGECAEDAVYMGILLSTNRFPPLKMRLNVLVDDGYKGLGDCHGMASSAIVEKMYLHDFAAQEHRRLIGLPYRFPPFHSRAFQFRIVVPNLHLAKGTLRETDNIEYDLILPSSCFKGKKPSQGEHEWEIWMGVRDWATPRVFRASYQFVQYIPYDVLMKDLFDLDLQLRIAANWTHEAIVEALAIEEEEEDVTFRRIIAGDKYGFALMHPYIAKKVQDARRKRWHHLATAGGISFIGLMAIPDDTLPRHTVSVGGIAIEEEAIMFRYPIRGPQDIRVVKILPGKAPYGCVAMSHETASEFGGDFDGDYFALKDASEMPNTALFLKSRKDTNEVKIKKRKERKRTPWAERHQVFTRAAVMSSHIPIIANLITSAYAAGDYEAVYALGQQLQIAVDGIKYDLELDTEMIARYSRLERPEWLRIHKSKRIMTEEMPPVNGNDTVSRIWNIAQKYFVPLSQRTASWEDFRMLVQRPRPEIEKVAKLIAWRLYLGPISAISHIPDNERQIRIREICRRLRRWTDGEDAIYQDRILPGLKENREDFFRAFWHIGCDHQSPIAFIAFPEECVRAFLDFEPAFVTKAGLKSQDGRVISWSASSPLIKNMQEDRRKALLEAMTKLGISVQWQHLS